MVGKIVFSNKKVNRKLGLVSNKNESNLLISVQLSEIWIYFTCLDKLKWWTSKLNKFIWSIEDSAFYQMGILQHITVDYQFDQL